MGLGIVQVPYRDACQAWEVVGVWAGYGSCTDPVLETACQMSAACEPEGPFLRKGFMLCASWEKRGFSFLCQSWKLGLGISWIR